jgi:parallel beta-helix repeat protein
MSLINKNRSFILFINLMLLISLFIPQITSDDIHFNNIIYVDDDGGEDFTKIIDALNAAIDGDTIFVYNGIYYENLIINKNISIIGESKENTIIDGNGIGGVVKIDFGVNICISNFTIQNGVDNTEERMWGIWTWSTDKTIIKNNIIKDNEDGIVIGGGSTNCIIYNNEIFNNELGFDLCTSDNNLIYGNNINDNNDYNLILYNSNNNLITKNNIYNAQKNIKFYNSKDKITQNYWGKNYFVYPIFGNLIIEVFGIYIPWLKFDWSPVSTINGFDKNPVALMDTSMGSMMIELYEPQVTNTVNNFVKLSEINFFNDIVFHRVIDDFVIQGGGFYSNGTHVESPFGTIDLEIHPEVRHVDGAISMARTSDPNSATSQFFICDGEQSRLDENYSAFGKIIVGIDVLRAIASVETKTKFGFYQDWPIDDVYINYVDIVKT